LDDDQSGASVKLRFCICIPVYNNPDTIIGVVEACLKQTELPLLVVDDGSDQSVEKMLPADPRLHVLRFEQNRGKGKALQEGFTWAIQNSYTHLLTLDGDGQHSARDIPVMLEKARQNPWALIVGDRNMSVENVPPSSVFGKKFSNFWIKYETEKIVSDSQSGYRVYPLYQLQNMRFFRKRYDFEVEILTRLMWKNVEVVNVPVGVRYFPVEERVSHFHKWKDNFLITLTNIILVLISLLSRNRSPLKNSLALALGVFVGVFPIYGLHTFIVFLLSFAFRWNFVYLWVGTQISIPPMVPLLLLSAGLIHNKIFPNWFFSFSLLALILGFAAFLVTYGMSAMRRKAKGPPSIVQIEERHLGIRIMDWVLKTMGLRPAYFLLYFIVPCYYLFHFRARRACSEYWKMVSPDLGFFSRQVKIFQQIHCFAIQMVDRAYQKIFAHRVFEFETKFSLDDFLKRTQADEKGFVCVNAHMGGWDFAASLFSEHVRDKKIRAVIYGEAEAYKLEAQSHNQSYSSLYFNQQSHGIVKLKMDLDRGQAVALMADRPVGKNLELVPFFGRLAVFDSTPFKIALMCQTKLCFIFCFRTKAGRYAIDVQLFDPATLDRGVSKEEMIYRMVTHYVHELEASLRKFPEQWYNFLPFWSQRIISN
jgi:predicted LPLAT superfamily acyltransferase/glycosyltransferase involved in cell wall biosynthesis